MVKKTSLESLLLSIPRAVAAMYNLVFYFDSKRYSQLQLVTRLLDRFLISCRRLTILDPSLNLRITLSLHTQFSRQYKHRGEMHHTVRSCWGIPRQEFPRTLLQLCFQKVHVVPDICGHAFFCLFYVAANLFPAGIQDRNSMKCPGCLSSMNPLELFVTFWIAEGSEQLMFFVICITQISNSSSDEGRELGRSDLL